LDINAVAFRIELFVVLEHGRKTGLSVARFIRVQGAASGFKRVLEVVDGEGEGVMRARGEEEDRWSRMRRK
jgi:serine/threonine-protein kinase HSL1 (negative regulator of Swe1 kinase)